MHPLSDTTNLMPSKSTKVFTNLIDYLLKNIRHGTIELHWPDGKTETYRGKENLHLKGVLIVHDWALLKQVVSGGAIGFGEGYLNKRWSSPHISILLEVLTLNLDEINKHIGKNKFIKLITRLSHIMRPNSRSGSKKNIYEHYDLGNNFYEKWLDPSMTYSSAIFKNKNNSLESAQLEKYKSLAQSIDLKKEHHVLEIGCGWGGFAEYAATHIGCRVTGLTISQAQYDYASARMEKKGLTDKVTIKLQDYRDVQGDFDRIASIEMFEAVGEKYWPTFFNKVSNILKPGGKAGLQIITIDDDKFNTYRKNTDFIQKYIFPGGMLPSKVVLKDEFDKAHLKLHETVDFRLDYAETLARWRDRFNEQWYEIKPMGFDERFKQMWEYYLAYCEAGFKTGTIDVSQFYLHKSQN
ncbi:MAG: SAM-dependent methyltransferase [Rhizobiales bacterium TMED249]|uniref:Class I SAM-dependent methyltransferase n=1 Tax=PS1 clade bacterium TaxID=2175152 RepID=A0A368E3R7_9PROT|nr:MAG: SAM-dependent methyltransferase [Rhizobiales bacterium TMED249]RCL78101.1 MAG: class I SAM-dependent methyltransferase [PS1 clade bacterium]HCV48297.1 SAM-dependent methyltransferase [Rhodobiaceae bacterium]